MQVKVKNNLSAAFLHIEEQFIPGLIDSLRLCHVSSRHHGIGHDTAVILGQIIDAADMFFGYNQQMNGSMRVDIPKHHYRIVFE
jgi:hypothetical protein